MGDSEVIRQYGIRVNAYSVCSDGFQCFLLLRLVFLAQETGACLDAVLIHFGGSRNRTLCIALYHKRCSRLWTVPWSVQSVMPRGCGVPVASMPVGCL